MLYIAAPSWTFFPLHFAIKSISWMGICNDDVLLFHLLTLSWDLDGFPSICVLALAAVFERHRCPVGQWWFYLLWARLSLHQTYSSVLTLTVSSPMPALSTQGAEYVCGSMPGHVLHCFWAWQYQNLAYSAPHHHTWRICIYRLRVLAHGIEKGVNSYFSQLLVKFQNLSEVATPLPGTNQTVLDVPN